MEFPAAAQWRFKSKDEMMTGNTFQMFPEVLGNSFGILDAGDFQIPIFPGKTGCFSRDGGYVSAGDRIDRPVDAQAAGPSGDNDQFRESCQRKIPVRSCGFVTIFHPPS